MWMMMEVKEKGGRIWHSVIKGWRERKRRRRRRSSSNSKRKWKRLVVVELVNLVYIYGAKIADKGDDRWKKMCKIALKLHDESSVERDSGRIKERVIQRQRKCVGQNVH